ncbi:MAG: anaerobic sulfatase maturase [Candidatus Lokiarchaeota archaeon]|nr:anaerobic sulfatase maturase [Candidatus Lokiarchaeota archaeon]
MKPFSLLIKPASADCNLRCDYCFYIDHLEKGNNIPRMTVETLEIMIKNYMSTDQNKEFSFGWQGGEPTLMGLDFFKKVVEFQLKYAPPGSSISNGIQTNATMITEELAKFFEEYKFLLGVSLDGPEGLHDYYRKTIGKKPTHALVMRGIEHLKQYGVEFNILTLINKQTVKKAKEIYQYFRDHEFLFHQYIPCVEFNVDGTLKPFSITGEEWGIFLSELFDKWVKEDVKKVSIRLFDSIMQYLISGDYNVCYMQDNCAQYFVVEHDGSVYPCDFFVQDNLLLGNINNSSWEELLNSHTYHNFGNQKSDWNKVCSLCPYLGLCHGDCQKFRYGMSSSGKQLSNLCQGWKIFYTRTLPRFKYIVDNFKKENKISEVYPFKFPKFGRNELCPCASGKKFKSCCGNFRSN